MFSDNTESGVIITVGNVLLGKVEWEASTNCYMTAGKAKQISVLVLQ